MKRSEFLKRMRQAAFELTRQSNDKSEDRNFFDWERNSIEKARAAGLTPLSLGPDEDNPVAIAVRKLCRRGHFCEVDMDALICLDEAWEFYSEGNYRMTVLPDRWRATQLG